MSELGVLGHGFFATRWEHARDALEDRRLEALRAPAFRLAQGRLRRFTSLVTQMHLEVCGQALERAQLAADSVVSVFASAYGETETTLELLRGINDQKVASAARFAQSVHNTPSGLFSIATGNRHPSTALAADEHTFARALCEAKLLSLETERPVLLSMADDAIAALLGSERPGEAIACCLLLGPGAGRPLPELAVREAPAHLRGSALWPMVQLLAALEAP